MKTSNTSLLKKIIKFAINIFFPKVCIDCKTDLSCLSESPLCPSCLGKLKYLQKPYCDKCARPLEFSRGNCYDCEGTKHYFDYARSALIFNNALRPILHTFKYKDSPYLAKFLGNEMEKVYDYFPEIKGQDSLVPVPLHKAKLSKRGYNQAELLAEELAKSKNLHIIKDAVIRIKDTPSQTTLSREERQNNVIGAFNVVKPELIKGKNILLIDDVATTLSTCDELAKTLLQAGAKSVSVYTLAREP